MTNQNTTQNPDVIAGRIGTNVQYDIVICNPSTLDEHTLCTSDNFRDAFFVAETISKTKSYQMQDAQMWVKIGGVYNGVRLDVNGERV